ncbi:MAG: RICIN domain-containing protein [Deltaproteobacteria bacterium]|nr:RICIN domain-containing protein [Deltaproteobacteria bacterium]
MSNIRASGKAATAWALAVVATLLPGCAGDARDDDDTRAVDDDGELGATQQALVTGQMLYNRRFGECADVANWSTADQAHVNRFGCHRGANQLWFLEYGEIQRGIPYRIRNKHSNKCLDRPWNNTASGTPIQQYGCHFGDAQWWIAEPVVLGRVTWYRFRAPNTNQCLFAVPDDRQLTMALCRPAWDQNVDNQYFRVISAEGALPPPP